MFQELPTNLTPIQLKEYIQEKNWLNYNEYLLFTTSNDEVSELINYLSSDTTISKKAFLHWQDFGAIVIGKTIDNDYLISLTGNKTVVLPQSFQIQDIEYFPMNTGLFLKTLEENQSPSTYIQ